MSRRKITDITHLVAEDMVSILDYLSRIKGAVDNNSPEYMHDKALSLARAAEGLYRHMSDVDADPRPPWRRDPYKRFDPTRLRKLITRDARYYEAGRALYPAGGSPAVAAARRALELAATEMRFNPPEGFTPAQADVIAGWLLARAEREASS